MIIVALHLQCVVLFLTFRVLTGQYANNTAKYQEVFSTQTKDLVDLIQTNPDVNLIFNPNSIYNNTNYYVYNYPLTTDFRIGIIMDPCRSNNYNCCMNVFGSPEYPALLQPDLESYRVYKYIVIASPDAVSKNYYLVDELGTAIPTSAQRTPDDYQIWNGTCETIDVPNSFCAGRNFKYERSPVRPPCEDNNSSLDFMAGCYDSNGNYNTQCLTIAYTSTAFLPQCKNNESFANDNCGTFLEVHIAHGTPYNSETDIISQVQLTTRNVSGYYTTTLPTTWMGNSSKVLCSYLETFLRVGSEVFIEDSAPVCCCPPPFNSGTNVGSFQCPIGPVSDGAFAYKAQTIGDNLAVNSLIQEYPFCPIDLSAPYDLIMCSVYDVENRVEYCRPCANVTREQSLNVATSWTSIDMDGLYNGVCPYYDNCALTQNDGKCTGDDLRFSFIGYTGIVTELNNDATIPTVTVTFNNNRTSYEFVQTDVKLETYKSQYELWWVVRSPAFNTVQKRKGFNITNPQCTFDTTNNRYFPYALLENGLPVDSSVYP